MKLFIREHTGLFFIQCIQLLLICLILILSGYRDYPILLYCVLLNFFLLGVYISFYYYRRRYVYRKLSANISDVQQLLEKTGNVPVGRALDRLTKSQYKLFVEQLKDAENDKKNHLKFIDRWVHQMKTPISVIELSAQELDEPESSNIREETDRIKNGLNKVLYMARMRTIQEDFQIKPVNLNKLIQAVNQENKRFFIRSNVYPRVAMEQDLTVETDEKWLFFIIDQLLQNAVKYTAGRSNGVDVLVSQKKGKAVIEISDHGVGIPQHDQKRIFQAFYTGDNGRKFRESTGMGLYLAKEVSDYLGHALEVTSDADVGTTATISFTETQTIG